MFQKNEKLKIKVYNSKQSGVLDCSWGKQHIQMQALESSVHNYAIQKLHLKVD